uniref:Uncharacterized protein n=1 Tax=Siphoviridae sp. cteRK31 TaxID=2826405 RepID=A0A8S5MKC7_9CAUD|nr:MAG TPA: hypothetical protein [Siphoviridae sp. cteRK31]
MLIYINQSALRRGFIFNFRWLMFAAIVAQLCQA